MVESKPRIKARKIEGGQYEQIGGIPLLKRLGLNADGSAWITLITSHQANTAGSIISRKRKKALTSDAFLQRSRWRDACGAIGAIGHQPPLASGGTA